MQILSKIKCHTTRVSYALLIHILQCCLWKYNFECNINRVLMVYSWQVRSIHSEVNNVGKSITANAFETTGILAQCHTQNISCLLALRWVIAFKNLWLGEWTDTFYGMSLNVQTMKHSYISIKNTRSIWVLSLFRSSQEKTCPVADRPLCELNIYEDIL